MSERRATPEIETPGLLHVVMIDHDDWLLVSDGRIYTFNTELWSDHGTDSNWPRVERADRRLAMQLAAEGRETWGLDAIPDTVEQFRKAFDFVAMAASDQDFRRFVLRFIG